MSYSNINEQQCDHENLSLLEEEPACYCSSSCHRFHCKICGLPISYSNAYQKINGRMIKKTNSRSVENVQRFIDMRDMMAYKK